ncbi:MAG: nuclear transport factor 2 family protein [Proteobacteria bacterium]|nr:nuclear transport factor 2 family protein [Pseudomonadota bacterium]
MSELDELRRRVQRLEDLEAIRRLKARYLTACDSQDPESAKNCFAPGKVRIDMGHVGVCHDREDWANIYRSFGCQPFILDMHHGANEEIELIDDSHARALWALDYRNFNLQARTVLFVSLIYHDEYARLDGAWKITASRSEFKTALLCSFADGKLTPILADRSAAAAMSYAADERAAK